MIASVAANRNSTSSTPLSAAKFAMVLADSLLEVVPERPSEIGLWSGERELALSAGVDLSEIRGPAFDWQVYETRLAEGYIYIPKSGGFLLPLRARPAFLAKAWDAYDLARATFQQFFASDLMLGFGTLLGCVRGNDFIGHDDDFDAIYVSRASDAAGLVEETFEIVARLTALGFRARPISAGQIHLILCNDFVLDIFSVWFSSDQFICYSIGGRGNVDDFLPAVSYEFRRHPVLIPNHFEVFLNGAYGPDWRTPDPNFQWSPYPMIQAEVREAKRQFQLRLGDPALR